MKTNDLRKLVRTQLLTIKSTYGLADIYYRRADDAAMFPHIVFDLDSISMLGNDVNRRTYLLTIDCYDRGNSAADVENLTDAVESLFNGVNLPQTNILPTFYFESRTAVLDEDKAIKHNQLKFEVLLFEK